MPPGCPAAGEDDQPHDEAIVTGPIKAAWRLTRLPEYVSFVVITTVLGAAAGGGSLGWALLVVLIANWLAVGFGFMINDVEDAPDDALTPAKAQRNPISSGELSPRFARLLSFSVAILAAVLYASLGLGPFLSGLLCLALGYLYSTRPFRLKARPVADLLSHALGLAGLQFVAAYLTFEGGAPLKWASALGFLLAISLYGQLFNQLRDFDGDRTAGVNHTASHLGRRTSNFLMLILLSIGIATAAFSILFAHLFPLWVLLVTLLLAVVLSLPRLPGVLKAQSSIEAQRPLQKPVEIAAAIALLLWFAGPRTIALISGILGDPHP